MPLLLVLKTVMKRFTNINKNILSTTVKKIQSDLDYNTVDFEVY